MFRKKLGEAEKRIDLHLSKQNQEDWILHYKDNRQFNKVKYKRQEGFGNFLIINLIHMLEADCQFVNDKDFNMVISYQKK